MGREGCSEGNSFSLREGCFIRYWSLGFGFEFKVKVEMEM